MHKVTHRLPLAVKVTEVVVVVLLLAAVVVALTVPATSRPLWPLPVVAVIAATCAIWIVFETYRSRRV